MRSGRFQAHVPTGPELLGKTLGIVGLGNIGGTLASYGKALGMKVIAWSQNLTEERAMEVGAERVSKEELFSRSHVVTVHLKLSERCRGIVGADEIARMKKGAILINTSRGPLIEERLARRVARIDGFSRRWTFMTLSLSPPTTLFSPRQIQF